jgi:DNA-binding CsgD family transcriptional regulator
MNQDDKLKYPSLAARQERATKETALQKRQAKELILQGYDSNRIHWITGLSPKTIKSLK